MPETIGSDGRIKDRTGIAPQGAVCRVVKTANQAISSGTYTVITWEAKEFDPYGWFNLATGRFQPKVPGYYRVAAVLNISGLAAAQTEADVYIRKNGVGAPGSGANAAQASMIVPSISTVADPMATALVYLNGTTDYLEIVTWAGSAGSVRGDSGYKSAFDAELVGVMAPTIPASEMLLVCNARNGGLPLNGTFNIQTPGTYWFMGFGSAYSTLAGNLVAIGFGIDTTSTQAQAKQYMNEANSHRALGTAAVWSAALSAPGSHSYNVHIDSTQTSTDTNDFFTIVGMRVSP